MPINSPVETTRIASKLVGVLFCLARLDLVAVKSLCYFSKVNFRYSGIVPLWKNYKAEGQRNYEL